MQAGELLVRRIPVAADDAALHPSQFAFDHLGRTRLVEDVVNYRAAVEYPEVPAMTDLVGDIHEQRPARLVGSQLDSLRSFNASARSSGSNSGASACNPPASVPGDICRPRSAQC